jgi:methyl-accepting chemotaxis protein
MMDSFSLITHKIIQTDESVRDVASASREQMDGINQINSAVSQLDQMTQLNAKTANNVAQIANEILYKTTQFEDMLTNIKYDKKYDDSSCDVNLLFTTTKLKLDHINFKDNNYAKLKSTKTPWRVVSHHECALGKWIDANTNTPFAKTKEWQKLLKEHEHVHQGVQTLINEDLSNAPKETIFALSQEIEKATSEVFAGLDGAKLVNCGTIKKETML